MLEPTIYIDIKQLNICCMHDLQYWDSKKKAMIHAFIGWKIEVVVGGNISHVVTSNSFWNVFPTMSTTWGDHWLYIYVNHVQSGIIYIILLHKFHMSFVFHFYILGLTSWIWTKPSTEGLKFESPSKWNSYEGFNPELWLVTKWTIEIPPTCPRSPKHLLKAKVFFLTQFKFIYCKFYITSNMPIQMRL